MAIIIGPKRTGTAAKVPTTSDLANGEFAINYTDQKCYLRVGSTVYLVASVGGSVAWGAITGTLSSQTDLQAALDAKVTATPGYWASSDANTANVSGFYPLASPTTNTPDGSWTTLIYVGGIAGRGFQIANKWNTSDGLWQRVNTAGTWGSWAQMWDSSNLVIANYAPLASPTFTGSLQATDAHFYSLNVASYDVADTAATRATGLSVTTNSGSGGSGGAVYFGSANSINFAYIKGYITNGTTNGTGFLVFGTRTSITDTSMTNKMILDSAGNLNLTTGNLTASSGSITATSNFIASGSEGHYAFDVDDWHLFGNVNNMGWYSTANGYGFRLAKSTKAASFFGNVDTTGNITGVNIYGASFVSTTTSWIAAPSAAGTMYLRPNGSGSSTGQTTIASSGAMVVASTVTATDHINSSDERLKHDITPIEVATDHLADLLQLCTWLWNENDSPGIGLIAQEVQKVAPQYVTVGADGMLGIDKAGIALEAVIGLAARVRELEAR